MNNELSEKLVNRFPSFFPNFRGSYRISPLAAGFECEDGWYKLLFELCEAIERLSPTEFVVEQVKEKFGGLRFYTSGEYNPQIDLLIDDAEKKSYTICEWCGATDMVSVSAYRGWVRTLCVNCEGKLHGKV